MAWDFTTIRHKERIQLGLSMEEYCVLDLIYHRQRDEHGPVDGWCITSIPNIGKDLGVATRTLKRMISKLRDSGFLETNESGKKKRATSKFSKTVYAGKRCQSDTKDGAKVALEEILNGAKVEPQQGQSGTPNGAKVAHSNIVSNISKVIKDISEQSSPKENPVPFAKIIIQYLSGKTGKRYRIPENDLEFRSSSKFKLINARFRQGYKIDEFVKVIDIKCIKWLEDEKMNEFLRPSTLFCASNFEKYLDEWENINNSPSASEIANNKNGSKQKQAKDELTKLFKAYKSKWKQQYTNQAQTDYIKALALFYKDNPELKTA